MEWDDLIADKKNIVFLGEAGCGKSEIALNLALHLTQKKQKVHFFDLDQTKTLFRARDFQYELVQQGAAIHFERQMADEPVVTGGVETFMKDKGSMVILDVGGGAAGARLIGGFAQFLNHKDTGIFYVVNPYQPWSGTVSDIDITLSAVLKAAHVKKVRFLANPNLGPKTTKQDLLDGIKKTAEMLSPYVGIEGVTGTRDLLQSIEEDIEYPTVPIQLMLCYPWFNGEGNNSDYGGTCCE